MTENPTLPVKRLNFRILLCSLFLTGCGSTVQTHYRFPAHATVQQQAHVARVVDSTAKRFNLKNQTEERLKMVALLQAGEWLRAYESPREFHPRVGLYADSQEGSVSIDLIVAGRVKSPVSIEVERALTTSLLQIEPRVSIKTEVLRNPM
jgi:hypothetical protein